jgi:hypothetical protein
MITLLALLLSGAQTNRGAELAHKLGATSDVKSLEALSKFGCSAVPTLAYQLKVTRTRKVSLSDRTVHRELKIVWTIAALRYITGMDFRTNIVSSPYPEGREMIRKGGKSGGQAFGVWMSRELVYFNNAKAQSDIFTRWKRFARRGLCRQGHENHDVLFWLYGIRQ